MSYFRYSVIIVVGIIGFVFVGMARSSAELSMLSTGQLIYNYAMLTMGTILTGLSIVGGVILAAISSFANRMSRQRDSHASVKSNARTEV